MVPLEQQCHEQQLKLKCQFGVGRPGPSPAPPGLQLDRRSSHHGAPAFGRSCKENLKNESIIEQEKVQEAGPEESGT